MLSPDNHLSHSSQCRAVEVALTSPRSTPEYINLLNEIMEESAGLSVLVINFCC